MSTEENFKALELVLKRDVHYTGESYTHASIETMLSDYQASKNEEIAAARILELESLVAARTLSEGPDC